MANNQYEEQMAAYVDAQEGNSGINEIEAQPIPFNRTPQPLVEDRRTQTNSPIAKSNQAGRAERISNELNRLGYHILPIDTLPTAGLFYPDGFQVSIRAARGEEIKHWSTMDDTEILSVNNAMNYIIERCVNVKSSLGGTWRDIKDVDKFYILLAIRELTFADDDQNLMLPVSETNNIPLSKEMIHYVEFPEELMKHYSKDEKCFIFRMKKSGKVIKTYIPSIGIQEWIANYVEKKQREQTQFDRDYIQYASILIPTYKGLTQDSYDGYIRASHDYGASEWALLSQVFGLLKTSLTPSIKYNMEDGTEQEVPLSFRGGIKSIFSVQDSISELCGD